MRTFCNVFDITEDASKDCNVSVLHASICLGYKVGLSKLKCFQGIQTCIKCSSLHMVSTSGCVVYYSGLR